MDLRAPAASLRVRLRDRGDGALVLRGARVPRVFLDRPPGAAADDLVAMDLTLDGPRLRLGAAPGAPAVEMGQRIVWPRTVDCHTHLDKGQSWARSPNPDGTFDSAGAATLRDRATFASDDDLRRRAEFQLAAAHAHGTGAIRSHVDADAETLDRRLGVLRELATDWSGRVELQLCPFGGGDSDDDTLAGLATRAARLPGRTLSLFLQQAPALPAALDHIFRAAADAGVALDFHADETLDPASHCLRAVAEAALRHAGGIPVLVGHACALMAQPEAEADRTLDLVAEAGIGIVSLPLCNSYLMDRAPGRTPRLRGGTLVHEMRARGIPVALGSDNARDGYYAYGDLDTVALFGHAARTLHLDHPVGDWPGALGPVPADLIGTAHGRIADGGPADLILFDARTWSEFLSRPESGRIVLNRGIPVDARPPAYPDLDDLKGLTP